MYSGEMCYWITMFCESPERITENEFLPQELGVMYLKKYIKIVEGPLKSAGWNADKAKQLLARLQQQLPVPHH